VQCLRLFTITVSPIQIYHKAFLDKINQFDGGIRQVYGINATAGIFATYPGNHLSVLGGIFDQVCLF
jgi:aquaporin-3